jgi:hypothetical protein
MSSRRFPSRSREGRGGEEKTRASEWVMFMAVLVQAARFPAGFSRCPPNSYRMADSNLSW